MSADDSAAEGWPKGLTARSERPSRYNRDDGLDTLAARCVQVA